MVACSKDWENENGIKIILGEYVKRKPRGRPTNKVGVLSAESNAATSCVHSYVV